MKKPFHQRSPRPQYRQHQGTDAYEMGESIALLFQSIETQEKSLEELSKNTSQQIREVVTLFERQGAEFRTEIRALGSEFSHSREPNWQLYLSIFGAVALLITGGWKITTQQTENTVAPIVSRAEVNSRALDAHTEAIKLISQDASKLRADLDTNRARDEVSEADRQKLNSNAEKLDSRLYEMDAQLKVVNAKLLEVETQFKASDQARNVQFANQLRWDAIFWEKAFGTKFPSEIQYYPNITGDGK